MEFGGSIEMEGLSGRAGFCQDIDMSLRLEGPWCWGKTNIKVIITEIWKVACGVTKEANGLRSVF
jgi:hypothetical protein